MQAAQFYQNALILLDKSTTPDRSLSVALISNMAQCFMNLGNFKDALSFCENAIKINPNH